MTGHECERQCPGCRGTGFGLMYQKGQTLSGSYLSPCPDCGGTGRRRRFPRLRESADIFIDAGLGVLIGGTLTLLVLALESGAGVFWAIVAVLLSAKLAWKRYRVGSWLRSARRR